MSQPKIQKYEKMLNQLSSVSQSVPSQGVSLQMILDCPYGQIILWVSNAIGSRTLLSLSPAMPT